MTRRRRQSRSSLPHIEPSMLREQRDRERIDRVWERLERNVALGTSSGPRSRGRVPVATIALAAGFALGIGAAGWLWSEKSPAETVVVTPAPEEDEGRQVFAAGAAPATYALPGGGELTLEPGSIIDTVSRDRGMLTLRLLRGEATLSTPAGAGRESGRLSMMIGRAQVTAAGRMHIRHDGDTAFVRVLDGSAEISAPDADRGMKAMVLGPREEANVPVRVLTASLDRPHHARALPPPEEEAPIIMSDQPQSEPTPIVVVVPAWVEACNSGDYGEAVKLLEKEGGSPTQVTDTTLLQCIGTGQQLLKNYDAAIPALERVVAAGADSSAMMAARDLARIYRRFGESDKAAQYDAIYQRLNKDWLLSEAALCEKIAREAEASNDQAVLGLSADYENQFPDAACTKKIRELVAAIRAKGGSAEEPATDEGDSGGASPYDGSTNTSGEEDEGD